MKKWLSKLVIWSLKGIYFSGEDKAAITAALLTSLNAFPINGVVTFDATNTLLVNNKPVDMQSALLIKEGAIAAKSNTALNLINDQLKYKAMEIGIKQGMNIDQIIFAKAVLWVVQEQTNLITTIARE
jgi:hypothetical protein